MKSLKLSPPWVTFAKKVEALFGHDPEVKIVFDEDSLELKLFVDNPVKADAIGKILPVSKTFGNVTVKTTVIPSNEQSADALFRAAFHGNPAVDCVEHVEGPVTGEINYVVFHKEVVQFFNDDTSDINGNCSTLYADIAKEVLEADKTVRFCTNSCPKCGSF